MGAPIIRLEPKTDVALRAKVQRLRSLAGRVRPEIMRRTNADALEWVQKEAVSNLNKRIAEHGRPESRTGMLARAIMNPAYSSATDRMFRFMIDSSELRAEVPYYASIEFGDRSQIGREIRFYFLGVSKDRRLGNPIGAPMEEFQHGHHPNFSRSSRTTPWQLARTKGGLDSGPGVPHGFVGDRIIGPREGKQLGFRGELLAGARRPKVIIKRPVPAYRYGTDAGRALLEDGIYDQLLAVRARELGLHAEGVKFVIHGAFSRE